MQHGPRCLQGSTMYSPSLSWHSGQTLRRLVEPMLAASLFRDVPLLVRDIVSACCSAPEPDLCAEFGCGGRAAGKPEGREGARWMLDISRSVMDGSAAAAACGRCGSGCCC